ncbi:cytochrome b/b6 domain-containing protein [Streptomyces sp. H10-C2]|uniref:cytochrome b/b6 domain-containing protein n=1 Tax=unclassified Streptomyces TaxID=2593676 RepID=UPI0024B99321|nr:MULTISPECIES: cytochrome b/b6 domain-containing protein [unclassified Streptomyces]MDJ0342887.1 cytochrome b/b6 domain-containing protein [Streptomyces sp. PH10-H1]MDJ0372660.1 cytochrome b/b6 domain-containing protein [Streptomyces sp. H10-C2]
MTRLPDGAAARTAPRPPARRLRRFSRAERWVHRCTAWLMGICVFTAACLYLPPLAELVGRRRLMVTVHEWSGLVLLAPLLAGMFFRALRADLRLLNRFAPYDWKWLRTVVRKRSKEGVPAGKFNAGQKLYAAFTAGAVLVMTGTGLMMWFTHLAPVLWRTGATFVHDWLALLLAAAITGHVWMAAKDPEARLGMRTGSVAPWWARREHSLWKPDDKD